jgi:hypothetical protein
VDYSSRQKPVEGKNVMLKTKLVAGLLLGLVMLSPRFLAQDDHAPLPEQCIADYNLWSGEAKESLEKLPLTAIQPREIEMWKCASVLKSFDSEHKTGHAVEMLLLTGTYSGHISHRALDFIQRRGLMKEFSQEDAAGQR